MPIYINMFSSKCFKASSRGTHLSCWQSRSHRTYLSRLAPHLLGLCLNWYSHYPALQAEHNHPGPERPDIRKFWQCSSAAAFGKTSRRNVPGNCNIGINCWREAIFWESGGFHWVVLPTCIATWFEELRSRKRHRELRADAQIWSACVAF